MLKLYSQIFNETFKKQLEEIILRVSLMGFIIHLALIALQHIFDFALLADFDLLVNPIAAIYTPFSFILVSEVYLLIYYIPRSFTQSVAKQYEVVALIIIRKIFKDISNIDLITDWFSNSYNTKLTVDMLCVLLIFLLIGLFKKTNGQMNKAHKTEETDDFIQKKKKVAVMLFFIFVGLSFYHLFTWSYGIYLFVSGASASVPEVNPIFYDDFFTVLILMDVWLLIISFKYTSNYFSLMRNSGFIISTVLIRIGISESSIISTVIMLLSIAFGYAILLLFKKYYQLSVV